MIAHRNLLRLNAATLALYAPGLDSDTYAERAFAFLTTLLPSDLIGYGSLDAVSGSLSASFDRHPPKIEEAFSAYGRLMRKHEAFSFDPKVNGGRPYAITDFYTRRQLRNLDIYQEVHAPMGFGDHCYIHVPAEVGSAVFFGLFRDEAFKDTDKELLELAQPHLTNARGLALAQSVTADAPLSPDLFAHLGFTPREGDVVYWLTQGKSNIEIGVLLKVRTDTVSGYLRTIYEKMGVENRVAATVWALEMAKKTHSRKLEGRSLVAPIGDNGGRR